MTGTAASTQARARERRRRRRRRLSHTAGRSSSPGKLQNTLLCSRKDISESSHDLLQRVSSGDVSLLQGRGSGAVHGVLRVVLQSQMPERGLDDVSPSDLQADSARAIRRWVSKS